MNRILKEIVWSSKLAYIVGLLTTDGNLSKDGRHITMRSSDKDLLVTFKKCLSLKNKITPSLNNGYAVKSSFRVQFGNVGLYKWLLSIGLTPAKSLTINDLKIPPQYFIDFLRGHLDGDGSIFTYQDKYNNYKGRIYTNQRLYVKFISASKNHILWLHNSIQTLLGLKGSLTYYLQKEKNSNPIWSIKFAKKESIKLLSLIYYESSLPCLERKMLLATQILKALSEEKRKIYTKI